MNKIRIVVLVLFLSMQSCTKQHADFRMAQFETPIITGFKFLDNAGHSLGTYGIPNVKTSNNLAREREIGFYAYPNPSIGTFRLNIITQNYSSPYYIWLVQAKYEDNISYTPPYIANALYLKAGAAPVLQLETREINPELDVRNIEQGYYRVYVKIQDEIYYDNIVITQLANQ